MTSSNTQQQDMGQGAHLRQGSNDKWNVKIQSYQGNSATGETQDYSVDGATIADAIVNAAATFGVKSEHHTKGADLSFKIVSCEQQGLSSSQGRSPGSSSDQRGPMNP